MTEIQYEIIRSAVNIARSEGVQHLSMLRERLQAVYPNLESDIDSALLVWANHEVKSSRRNGMCE